MALSTLDPAALPPTTGYGQVVSADPGGRIVFVAGQVSVDAGGNVVAPGDRAGQARQAFANLRAALEGAGAKVDDVAKITWYVVGFRPEMLPELAAARSEVFAGHRPTSTLVGVEALAAPEFLVEVDAIAVVY